MNKRKIKEIIIRTKEKTLDIKGDIEKKFKIRDNVDAKKFYLSLVIVFLVLIYLIFIRGYFVKKKEVKVAEEKAKTEQVRQERIEKIEKAPKSRISFFLSGPVKANLAIPDYWEGNYRLKESNGKASFLYIGDATNPVEVFYVKFIPESELVNLELGEQEIKPGKRVVKDDTSYAFIFKMSEDNPYKEDEDLRTKFDRMRIDGKEMVIKYFKTF